MTKTTREQFELFETEALFWLDRFGLTEWETFIVHEDCQDSGTLADCGWRITGRQARIRFNLKIIKSTSWEHIARAAFHEVCELMLSDTTDMLWRGHSEAVVERETHRIIRRLENAV